MENYSTYRDAISEAEKAEGTSARKMQAYNESVAYSINQLSAAWEGFAQKLEASGAVKLFFQLLTASVENFGRILSTVLSMVVSLRSFKLTTDLKRLADFFGFGSSEGKGRLKTKWDKTAAWFSPNRMTQQAAQEKEKYEQQKAGTYEEQSRNKIVNSNNRVVDALNRNADALDRNSAAQRGENAPKASGTTQSSRPSTGSTVSIGAIKKARKEYEAAKQKSDQYAEGVFVGAHKQTADAKANYDRLRKLRAQELKANWKQSAIRGVGTGLTAGVISGMSAEGDLQDKVVTGASTAITTGLISAIPGVGMILGPILGPVLGEFFGKEINKLLKADEVARKERAQQAKDNLEAIKEMSASVTGLIDIRKKGESDLWDADDWKQVNEYVDSINKAAKASESFSKAINGGITNIEKMTEAQLADIEAARIKYEAEQTYAAGEQDRYTLMKEISENQKKVNDKDVSVAKQAQAAIVSATAQLDEYREALRDSYLQSAFYSSHVSAMSSVDISSATLDRVIMEIAREWAEKGVSGIFDASGYLTGSARTDIVSFLREQSGYEGLFNNKSKDVYEIKNALNLFGGDKALIEELKELARNQDISKVEKRLQELGKLVGKRGTDYNLSDLNNLIDKINTADTTSIATIAHSLNMTVEQFEKANKDGAFDWLTTEDALNGADKFLEKMTNLSSIFADLSKNAALSSENIQKVFSSYRFLLRGENGNMSTENIAKNLGDIFLNGINSQAAQAYIGLKISDAKSDRDLWKAFISDETVMAELSPAEITKLKASDTYEGAADIVENNEIIREKFWKLASESAGEMDLFKEMRDILVEYQTSTYDTEISNLESIKDALGDVNKQREKELELIKAKEALENASKEKKRVYRAGVGFVYTTDQEAVKAAQDKVDELERQKTQDDIQYQIDVLEQQKSILENVAKNEEMVALKESIDKFFGGVTAGNLIDAIFATNDPEKQAALRAEIAASGSEGAAAVRKEVAAQEALDAYSKALNEYKETYLDEDGNFKISEGDVRYKDFVNSQIDAVNNLINLRKTAEDAAKRANFDTSSIENVPDKLNGGKRKYRLSDVVLKYKDHFSNKDVERSFGLTSNLTSNESFLAAFGRDAHKSTGNFIDKYVVLEFKDGKYQSVSPQPDLTSFNNGFASLDEAKSLLKDGQILVHDRSDWHGGARDYAVYKGYDGNIYDIGDSGHIHLGSNSVSFASGTLSYPGGRSLINENGLESIITPQGTITSLPAKSGIVPADLTRNLWALGEVAPNLIARLGGNSLQTNNSNSSTDNSINIQNLDATFNTQSDFDGRRFLTDLRNQVILTANNH